MLKLQKGRSIQSWLPSTIKYRNLHPSTVILVYPGELAFFLPLLKLDIETAVTFYATKGFNMCEYKPKKEYIKRKKNKTQKKKIK